MVQPRGKRIPRRPQVEREQGLAMSDESTGREVTPTEEAIQKVLGSVWVAKSRATNKLSQREIDSITTELLNALPQMMGEITTVNPDQWFGVDRQNDKLYRSTKKSPVLASWLGDMQIGAGKESVTRVGEGVYYYSYPRNVDRTEELWLVRRDKLAEQGIVIPDIDA